MFDRAIFVGRRARSQTSLGRLGHSIGSLAARELTDALGDLRGRRGVLVGAGEAARDAARCLAGSGAELQILNRTFGRAAELARAVGGIARPFDQLDSVLSRSEFVVAAIHGAPVRLTGARPLVVIDLSSSGSVVAVESHRVCRLEDLSVPAGPEVRRAIIEAEAFINTEVDKYEARLHRSANPSDNRSANPSERERRIA